MNLHLSARILPICILGALFFADCGASAQTAASDEAIGPAGEVVATPALTTAQRETVYTAVMRQRVRNSEPAIAPVIGAPVPASATLRDLPGNVGFAEDEQADLKYATVADDVVVVDPIRMRVVDVIHSGVRP